MDNLLAYCLQIAILAAAGTLLAYIFRLRIPRISLYYWQVLLIACLALPLLQKWEKPAAVSTNVTMQMTGMTVPNTGTDVASSLPSSPKISTTGAIVLVFAAGALLRLLWLVLGFYRLRLLLRRSEPIDRMPHAAERICSLIGVRARFYLSDETDSPATFGIFNPKVILPRTFPDMREACREAVLCHELLHVRRRDWALIFIEEIIRTVFWFHPAVWWLLSRIHLTREQSVDHEVVKLTGNRQPYLDSLLEIARKRGRPRAVPAPLFLRERHLVERVALLIKEVSMNRLRLALSLVSVFALLAGTVHFAAGWFPLTGTTLAVQEDTDDTESEPQQTSPAPPPTPTKEGSIVGGVVGGIPDGTTLPPPPPPPNKLPPRGIAGGVVGGMPDGQVPSPPPPPPTKDRPKTIGVAGEIPGGVVGGFVDVSDSSGLGGGIGSGEGAGVGPGEGAGMGSGLIQNRVDSAQSTGAESNSSKQTPKRIGSNVLQSKLIHRVAPVYPEEAKAGQVILNVTVNEKGDVTNVEVLDGDPLHIDAVVAAVKQWKYEPILLNGKPIPVIATITVKRDVVSPTQFVSPTEIPINPNPNNAKYVGSNVLQSKLVHKVDPEYPELAKRARVKGTVTLGVTVNEEGHVSHVEVIGGHPMLLIAAEKAVKQWKYEPTILNGKAIPVFATVTVNFVLPEDTDTNAPAGELRDPDATVISLDESGQVSIDKEPVPMENLGGELQKLFRERPNKTLFLRVPANVNYSDVKKIVDIAKEAGADEIGLVTAKNR